MNAPRVLWRCTVRLRPGTCRAGTSYKPHESPKRGLASISAATLQFGQPLHETHPHILKAGELTPGITALEYAERRARLAQTLPPKSFAIIPSADIKYRSGSVFYKFHQDADFLYLTGFQEPDSLAVIEKTGSGSQHIFHLFVRPNDPRTERWEGSRSGVQAAEDVFNADQAHSIEGAFQTVSKMVDAASSIYTDIPVRPEPQWTFAKMVYGATDSKAESVSELLQRTNVKPIRPIMNELRALKSEAEIILLREAGRISGRIFNDSMRMTFSSEKDLENYIEYGFKANGCEDSAYVPVVAGGERACQIHYVRNDQQLDPSEFVCVDAGGECGGYVTDITRTWPVNGKFNDAQRDLYEMILRVQRSCVSLCREDAELSLDKLHGVAEKGLRDGLKQLGFDLSRNNMEALFPHHVGHHIGLGVHDTPGYSRNTRLKTGQCITIEPGVYVDDDERWPKHFRGMGIRIEDSVCIQPDSPLILTTEAVKEVVDIEALRKR